MHSECIPSDGECITRVSDVSMDASASGVGGME